MTQKEYAFPALKPRRKKTNCKGQYLWQKDEIRCVRRGTTCWEVTDKKQALSSWKVEPDFPRTLKEVGRQDRNHRPYEVPRGPPAFGKRGSGTRTFTGAFTGVPPAGCRERARGRVWARKSHFYFRRRRMGRGQGVASAWRSLGVWARVLVTALRSLDYIYPRWSCRIGTHHI